MGGEDVKCTFAGTAYHLRLSAEAKAAFDAAVRDAKAVDDDGAVEVEYIGENGEVEAEDEVDAAWLACVTGQFAASWALLDAGVGGTDAKESVLSLVKKAARAAGTDPALKDAMDASLATDAAWEVAADELFGDCDAADVLPEAFAVDLGFRADGLEFSVPPASHALAWIFCKATQHLEADAADTTPCAAGSSLSPADLAVLRAADDADAFAAAFKARAALPAQGLHYIGHLLHNEDLPQGVFDTLVRSPQCWEWLSERGVEKAQRMIVVGGKAVTYSCRLQRVTFQLFPTWPAERQELFVNEVRERHAKAAVQSTATAVLSDPVADAIEALLSLGDDGPDGADDDTADDQTRFEAAVQRARALPSSLSNDDKLALYALFKQATEGDNTRPKPGLLDFAGRAKWTAWDKKRGVDQDSARADYIALVKRLATGGKGA